MGTEGVSNDNSDRSDNRSEPSVDEATRDNVDRAIGENSPSPANNNEAPSPDDYAASQEQLQQVGQYERERFERRADQQATDAPDPDALADDIIARNTTTRNQRGGQPPKHRLHMDGVAADVVHAARTDPELAGSVYNSLADKVDADALEEAVNAELMQDHLADAALLGDAPPREITPQDAQAKAAELLESHTRTQQIRQHERTTIDVNSMAYEIEQLALTDPSLAVAAQGALSTMLNASQASDLSRIISGGASWSENVQIAFENPGDGAIGAGKGMVNGISDLAELAGKGVALRNAAENWVGEQLFGAVGLDGIAGFFGGQADAQMEIARNLDLPEFELTNRAQQGGETIGMVIDVALAGKGIITGGAKILARNADELAAAGTRVIDDLATAGEDTVDAVRTTARAADLPTARQLEAAGELKVDPKWVDPDGSIKWPPNYGFTDTPQQITLEAGTRIDRYGSPRGGFLSPADTPFEQRALPASSADAQYTVYEVVKPLPVNAGEAAPWFDQIGGGVQYQLQNTNVQKMLDAGYLRVVDN